MTQFFLVFSKEKDQYYIKTLGSYHLYRIIPRKEGYSDKEFEQDAIRNFDGFIKREQILKDAIIIKSDFIF